MRAIYMSAVVIAAMSWSSGTLAQEVVPTPVPEEATNSGPALAAPRRRRRGGFGRRQSLALCLARRPLVVLDAASAGNGATTTGIGFDYDANRAAMPAASYAGVYHPGVAVASVRRGT